MAEEAPISHNQPDGTMNTQVQTPVDELQMCSFFKKIPLEVRNEIYKFLLVNPMLGQSDLETNIWKEDGLYEVKYELETSVLSTCRQAYNEASNTLYGLNTSYIYCMGS